MLESQLLNVNDVLSHKRAQLSLKVSHSYIVQLVYGESKPEALIVVHGCATAYLPQYC